MSSFYLVSYSRCIIVKKIFIAMFVSVDMRIALVVTVAEHPLPGFQLS